MKLNAMVISIMNNKGGVGKSTSTVVLAELLNYLNKKVLVIDLDQQGDSSMSFHYYQNDSDDIMNGLSMPKKADYHICELFKYRYMTAEDVASIIRPTYLNNVFIIPSSRRHKYTAAAILNNTGNNNIILKRAVQCVRDQFDYILIDNAPASDILTVNSMFASDYVIVPVRVENYSYEGLQETLKSLLYIKQEHDLDKPEFLGAFISQVNIQTNVFKLTHQRYDKELNKKFFKTPIRMDTRINEIETGFEPLIKHSNSNALIDYSNLLLEMNILDARAELDLKESVGAI